MISFARIAPRSGGHGQGVQKRDRDRRFKERTVATVQPRRGMGSVYRRARPMRPGGNCPVCRRARIQSRFPLRNAVHRSHETGRREARALRHIARPAWRYDSNPLERPATTSGASKKAGTTPLIRRWRIIARAAEWRSRSRRRPAPAPPSTASRHGRPTRSPRRRPRGSRAVAAAGSRGE